MNFFRYGNKAALVVGVILMMVDSATPIAHEFGAWQVGCMFCVWYSGSAIKDDERIGKKLKRWLYAYLAVVFVLAVLLHESVDSSPPRTERSISSSLKAFEIRSK
jgi:hypothetical protein